MIVTDQLAFFQLQKTGSTQVEKILVSHFGGEFITPKHERHDDFPYGNRLLSGGIRHPLDWYTSLWSFGCNKRGGFFKRMTRPRDQRPAKKRAEKQLSSCVLKLFPDAADILAEAESRRDPAFWLRLYQDQTDYGAFREWVLQIHQPENRFVAQEEFGFFNLFGNLGFFSFRYLKLYAASEALLFSRPAPEMNTFEHLRAASRVHHFVQTERLESGLAELLRASGHEVPNNFVAHASGLERANEMQRERNFFDFYTPKSLAFIESLDGLIGRYHGYDFAEQSLT